MNRWAGLPVSWNMGNGENKKLKKLENSTLKHTQYTYSGHNAFKRNGTGLEKSNWQFQSDGRAHVEKQLPLKWLKGNGSGKADSSVILRKSVENWRNKEKIQSHKTL